MLAYELSGLVGYINHVGIPAPRKIDEHTSDIENNRVHDRRLVRPYDFGCQEQYIKKDRHQNSTGKRSQEQRAGCLAPAHRRYKSNRVHAEKQDDPDHGSYLSDFFHR